MFRNTICVFLALAPTLVSTSAFLSSGPRPTLIRLESDSWSPAPTVGPQLDAIELLRRVITAESVTPDRTCGFVSGDASQPITCQRADFACATRVDQGVRGCCDPNDLKACVIPTACVPSSSLSASCDKDCSNNVSIQKCTDSKTPECYARTYIYPTGPVFFQYGCATSAFTQTVYRFAQNGSSTTQSALPVSSPTSTRDFSPSTTSSAAGSPTPTSDLAPHKKSSKIAPIVGGVVGGLAAIVIGILLFYLGRRSKKSKSDNASSAPEVAEMASPNMTDYKTPISGYASPGQYGADTKPWGTGYGSLPPYGVPVELPHNGIVEMEGEQGKKMRARVHEMSGG